MRIALVTVFAMALPFSAQAGLRFEATSVEIKPEPGEPQVVAKFPFKNTSDKNVTIFATESDCGCTTAGLEKKEYGPGEAGTITATFAIGDRTGAQVKQIRVRASDQSEPHLLTLKTFIPVFARIEPQYVYWINGEPPLPKSMVMEVLDTSVPIETVTSVSNNPGIKPQVRELEKGRRFEIVVTPGATQNFQLATIQLVAQPANGKPPRVLQAYARVNPKP